MVYNPVITKTITTIAGYILIFFSWWFFWKYNSKKNISKTTEVFAWLASIILISFGILILLVSIMVFAYYPKIYGKLTLLQFTGAVTISIFSVFFIFDGITMMFMSLGKWPKLKKHFKPKMRLKKAISYIEKKKKYQLWGFYFALTLLLSLIIINMLVRSICSSRHSIPVEILICSSRLSFFSNFMLLGIFILMLAHFSAKYKIMGFFSLPLSRIKARRLAIVLALFGTISLLASIISFIFWITFP